MFIFDYLPNFLYQDIYIHEEMIVLYQDKYIYIYMPQKYIFLDFAF